MWHDLSGCWDELKAVAEERNAQKSGFRSSRYWNAESHFLGLLGEQVYALEHGLAVDKALRLNGDGGTDFGSVDVKTTKYWQYPILKHPVQAQMRADRYALVGIDIDRQRGMLIGEVTADRLRRGKIEDFGYGPQYTLDEYEITHDLQKR